MKHTEPESLLGHHDSSRLSIRYSKKSIATEFHAVKDTSFKSLPPNPLLKIFSSVFKNQCIGMDPV